MAAMPSPAIVEFCGHAGFEWVLVDGEHDLVDSAACYGLSMAADAVGIALMARVPANRPELLLGFAESGAQAVLVPHVRSRAEAEDVVGALRFPPRGRRGLHSRTRAARYGFGWQSPQEYFESDDHHAVPVAMIEDVEALEALPEIASVEGLDVFVIGPNDLSGSMGIPGQDSPRVRDAVNEAARFLTGAGKHVVMFTPTPREAIDAVGLGAKLTMTPIGRHFAIALTDYLGSVRSALES
jgi:4-hydroxy-2-oxoheptanedioate aldolase